MPDGEKDELLNTLIIFSIFIKESEHTKSKIWLYFFSFSPTPKTAGKESR